VLESQHAVPKSSGEHRRTRRTALSGAPAVYSAASVAPVSATAGFGDVSTGRFYTEAAQ
jgi:hypothetical protein